MTIFSLGFEGLPYISPNYGGDKNVAIRAKIKKRLSTLGIIKKLFIDENKNNGRVLLDIDNKNPVISIINASPIKMLKFSWEQPILNMKTEKPLFSSHKAWLFLEVGGTAESTEEILLFYRKKEKLISELEYEDYLAKTDFEDSYKDWILEQEIIDLERVLIN